MKITKNNLKLGVAALVAVQLLSSGAIAQEGPTLEDLAVIDGEQQQTNNDTSRDLAQDAAEQDPALKQPAKADARYADPETEERIVEQSTGQYGDMQRNLNMSLGTTQDAWNKPFDNMSQGQVAPGIVRFRWSQDMVMPVRMREFMNTVIVLPDWENIKDVYLGEAYTFEAKKLRTNSVALRVKNAGVDTSLNILGQSGNIYTFYLRAEGFNTRSITDLNVFVDAAPVNPEMWFQGNGQAMGAQAQQTAQAWNAGGFDANAQPAQAQPQAISGSNLYLPSLDLKFVHKMFAAHPGDGAIAPEYVATDGRWTYFYYGDKAGTVNRPVVYRLVDGVEERVATRTIGTKGETLIAEAVGEFVLRNGQKIVCIKLAGAETAQPE